MQVGVRGQVDLQERTFCAANGREIIISCECTADLRRTYVQSRHPVRLHPHTHGESASSENIRLLHATDCRQPRLYQTHEIISDLVRLKDIRSETQICGSKSRIRRFDIDHWNLRFGRQIAPDRIDL